MTNTPQFTTRAWVLANLAVMFVGATQLLAQEDRPAIVHGFKGGIRTTCTDRQIMACKLWAIDAAAAARQWLIPTVTCESGMEIMGGPLAGPMTFCGAYVVNPVTGEHVPLPPPPVTSGR